MPTTCRICNGSGKAPAMPEAGIDFEMDPCPRCQGSGQELTVSDVGAAGDASDDPMPNPQELARIGEQRRKKMLYDASLRGLESEEQQTRDLQDKLETGEPMDIAWRLLKNEDELARYDDDSDQYDEEADMAMMDKWAEDTKQLLPTLSIDDIIDEKGNFKPATNSPYPPGHWSHKHGNWRDALGWDEDSYDLFRPYSDEARRRRVFSHEAETREKAEREEKKRMQQEQEKTRADKMRALAPQITEITRRFQDAFKGQGKWLDVSDKPIPRSVINSVMEEERGHARIAEFPPAWKHALARIEEFQGIDEDIETGKPMDIAWQLLKGKKPDPRLKAAGVSGYNKPKRTPNHPKKSHVVVARSGGKVKTIRFGEQGADTVTEDNPKGKRAKKRASFKARHQKNIKRGPMSAAYWADKVKW